MVMKSKLLRLQVLNEWKKSLKRGKASCSRKLQKKVGSHARPLLRKTAEDVANARRVPQKKKKRHSKTSNVDDNHVTVNDRQQQEQPAEQPSRVLRLPRSPLLRAMDPPSRILRTRSSKRMVLLQLALSSPSAGVRAKGKPGPMRSPTTKPRSPRPPSVAPPTHTAQDTPQSAGKPDAAHEIHRILQASTPEEILQVAPDAREEAVAQAWKKLVLLLHPDKLQRLEKELRTKGADALHEVHEAKEEMKRRSQETCAQVPAQPVKSAAPRLLESIAGSRKYEISWVLPETHDPKAPVEKYEVWGPRYFSEPGDAYDWVLLATLPPLQSQFIIVEEAPTQQDVMWAADRVLRQTLPLAVHAVNGKGQSEALSLELPWALAFPWLRGVGSLLCNQCLRLTPRGGRQGWTACSACGVGLEAEHAIVVRCPECGGEVLWQQNSLDCTSCRRKFGQHRAQKRQQTGGGRNIHQSGGARNFQQNGGARNCGGRKQW
eukprot:TRINITY_DN24204_c0_g1_i1.p1 TRINITY_DN24204_c0_g1~~TRINITY_DN24204_c0_g1_i1.p1  ORF type:complete len:489 (+),score=90.07 TRINITY_DN24204_c0_g1_i1:46-1512(+)